MEKKDTAIKIFIFIFIIVFILLTRKYIELRRDEYRNIERNRILFDSSDSLCVNDSLGDFRLLNRKDSI